MSEKEIDKYIYQEGLLFPHEIENLIREEISNGEWDETLYDRAALIARSSKAYTAAVELLDQEHRALHPEGPVSYVFCGSAPCAGWLSVLG